MTPGAIVGLPGPEAASKTPHNARQGGLCWFCGPHVPIEPESSRPPLVFAVAVCVIVGGMKVTGKNKICVALAGASLLALAADQVLFAGPREEGAASSAPDAAGIHSGAMTAADLAVLLQPMESQDDRSLAERLRRIARTRALLGDGSVRDAFALPTAWTASPQTPEDADTAPRQDDFSASHRLDAVMTNARVPCAMVDTTLVLVGQRVGGYTLEAVGQRSAVFIRGETRIEMHLDDGPIATTDVE